MGGWGFDDDEVDERTLLAAGNGRRQARLVQTWVLLHLRPNARRDYVVDTNRLCALNGIAMHRLMPTAGQLRQHDGIEIGGSKHIPPPHADVPRLLEEACAYVNQQVDSDPLHLAAYFLWRVCWIHPFEDGNGRTARAGSYLVLSCRLRQELPGAHPIPHRIKSAPIAFYQALEAADRAWLQGRLDVSELQRLLEHYLEAQLRDDPVGLPPGR